MRDNGYTLMELVVVIGVLIVVIGAGMNVFYQSLRSGAKIDYELFLDGTSRVVENSMSLLIRYGQVVGVEGQDDSVCLSAGSGGVVGNTLVVAENGRQTEYALISDFIASSSSQQVRVSPEGMKVNAIEFNWVCGYGKQEKVVVSYRAQAEKDDQVVPVEESYSFEVLVKNSGYY
ncbi:hypothetical protein KJ953_03065 [Patescibacteria group bacterium]|nr:hypothetical protein [Patescibacteria group bacterium]MBU1256862.1 hypothetical protein [Patescibacteria group bacterium]MBU1457489.1 hypothetical protein [Patescibacteria group bacterium]